jgi:alpha-L-rhamnosidase
MNRAPRAVRFLLLTSVLAVFATQEAAASTLHPAQLRVEWLSSPAGVDAARPRLSWRVESAERGQRQTAFHILVASSPALLAKDRGDLWDSGKQATSETLSIPYGGKELRSAQRCHWKVRVWDKDGAESEWSEPAHWSMGLIEPFAWKAEWISYRDTTPLHTNRQTLHLPPARHYRKEFRARKTVKAAMLYASALGLFEFHLNGERIGDAYFEPGWADYAKRGYYRTYDVTHLVQKGPNAIGAIVAEGWYSGYVGYGLLVGYGPARTGRSFYGKTPAVAAQLELEYSDGTRELIGTDPSWQVTERGPIREADLIMGESYDARAELGAWTKAGYTQTWPAAIPAALNDSTRAIVFDSAGERETELGFQKPPKMQAYLAPPIRVTAELPAQRLTEPEPGTYIFDLGQNIAGIIRLKVRGAAGTQVRLRYGEMLHPNGRLMTENLRRARATDYYTLRGDPNGETWSPRFTYHGFQFVEITGLAAKPGLDAVTGLVLHNDTPLTGTFECSDEVMTRFAKNALWTQRANFVEVPTDCPQRDERLGWMGDAQTYVRTATFNADVAAFFNKWLDDVEEAQRDFGAFPDYCPYPMAHGTPRKTFGAGWTDAGVICPWTIWKVYGDTRVVERHWNSLTRFMAWRAASTSPDGLGVSIGNPWGDWLNVGENTPIEFIDTCYHALDCRLMAEMAEAIGQSFEARQYRQRFVAIKNAFGKSYVTNGLLSVDTQSAYVLALWTGLMPDKLATSAAETLASKIARNGHRMATGFLGTRALLPVLSAHGQHDMAVRLFQNRIFPSWGYEVVNGATTVWERWDSFTKEHGFDGATGKNNAAMNSFSHYSFGAVMEWAYRVLAGIDTDGSGYARIQLRPSPPAPGSNPDQKPIDWVRAEYDSARGRIISHWRQSESAFEFDASVPANTTATVFLPAASVDKIEESGKPLSQAAGVRYLRMEGDRAVLEVGSGSYRFVAKR